MTSSMTKRMISALLTSNIVGAARANSENADK